MSLSNSDIDILLKEKDKEITETINSMEQALMKEDSFDRAKSAFVEFGRLEQLYIEFRSLLKNKNII